MSEALKVRGEWQTCPVCQGTGLVSRPPWVAGDVMMWSDNGTSPYKCNVCHGVGVIPRPEMEIENG